jgi:hypothetical protein
MEPDVLASFMSLKLNTVQSGQSVQTGGTDEMGQAVAHKATFGGQAVPETILFHLDRFEEFRGHLQPVEAVLSLRFKEAGPKFTLTPVTEMLSTGEVNTLSELHGELHEELEGSWAIYRGLAG